MLPVFVIKVTVSCNLTEVLEPSGVTGWKLMLNQQLSDADTDMLAVQSVFTGGVLAEVFRKDKAGELQRSVADILDHHCPGLSLLVLFTSAGPKLSEGGIERLIFSTFELKLSAK